ncbi:hypothetical protein [Microbacterium sp.]|uniref:hypothetical protein n=1 Tax=Microbacterium sp. TaxID=51671 RepID=UPI002FDFB7B7
MSDTTLDDFRDSWACEHVRAEITPDERREEFDRMIAQVRAEALREAADAFEGGAINVEVFRGGLEIVYWRAANKTRRSIVSSLRARDAAARIRGELS